VELFPPKVIMASFQEVLRIFHIPSYGNIYGKSYANKLNAAGNITISITDFIGFYETDGKMLEEYEIAVREHEVNLRIQDLDPHETDTFWSVILKTKILIQFQKYANVNLNVVELSYSIIIFEKRYVLVIFLRKYG
jgi:hypothetical protein